MATITNIGIFPTTLEIRENILKELAPGESVDILDKYVQCSHIQNGIENGWIKITSNLGSIRASYNSLGVFSGITNANGDVLPVAKSVSLYQRTIPQGLSWITDSLPGIDLYAVGFSSRPTIFFDPSAVSSQGLGTLNNPFNTQAQLQAICSGDMSGQVLGFKRGTTLRVTGVDGLVLDCYGSVSKPFTICPYGEEDALPIITAGVITSGWVQHFGNVYKLSGVTQNTDLFQNEIRLFKKSSIAALTGEGMAYFDLATTTLYAWAYGSVNPNSVLMEIQGSDYALNVKYSNVPASGNVIVVGMECRKGRNISLRVGYPTISSSITSATGVGIVGCRSGQAGYDAAGLTTASDAILLYGPSNTIRATNSYILGCEGYDALNNAYETANVDGFIFDSNYGHDVGGNSILELWASCSNCQVRNNLGERSKSTGRLFAGYHAGGIWATVFSNVAGTTKDHAAFQNNSYDFNIVRDSEIQGIEIYGGTGNKVRHNTIYNAVNTPTNRLLNLFTNSNTPGTCDAEVSNNVMVCGNTSNRYFIDILQGSAVSSNGSAIVSTITGDNNTYLSYQGMGSAGLRVNGVGTGASTPAPYKTAAAPFDANCIIKLPSSGEYANAFISDDYRPLTTQMKTGGKTGLNFKRYKDGSVYINSSVAVGALSK